MRRICDISRLGKHRSETRQSDTSRNADKVQLSSSRLRLIHGRTPSPGRQRQHAWIPRAGPCTTFQLMQTQSRVLCTAPMTSIRLGTLAGPSCHKQTNNSLCIELPIPAKCSNLMSFSSSACIRAPKTAFAGRHAFFLLFFNLVFSLFTSRHLPAQSSTCFGNFLPSTFSDRGKYVS